MAHPPTPDPGDEPVDAADAADQQRETRPVAAVEAPHLDGEVSEYDALEQARVVALDEDEEGHDPSDAERFDAHPG